MPDPLDELLPRERLGATVVHDPDGGVRTRFEVWAPAATTVTLELSAPDERRLDLGQTGRVGCWVGEVEGVGHGARYRFSIDGGEPLPDPASAWQPDGVHGASAVVDTATFGGGFAWTDAGWRGVALDDLVLYELHVGTFTPAGTFDAAIERLADLAELGVTAIELMPVNAFPGERNWGYDGVFPGAVQHSYGGPAALARFVDAAHAHGLAVHLDVVLNHLGPEGNVLGRYGPYFTDEYRTPWGDAINVAGAGSDGVRRYLLDVVRRWIVDHHVDGLRLDAAHALIDPTANPFWEQLATAARLAARAARRDVLVVAETADNDPRYLRPPDRGGYGLDAVWSDDLHHALYVALTDDRHGYYADYTGTAEEIADIVAHRWKYRGQHSVTRGRLHGRPVDDVAPARFVVCLHNHDQVGNRPLGDRLDQQLGSDATARAKRRLGAAVVLLSPFTPLLFMGDEHGDPAPFPFFVDHGDPALLEATREGRTAEFAGADWSRGDVPDPGDPATFRLAVLDPSLAGRDPHRALRAMYAELLRLRREVPALRGRDARQEVTAHGDAVVVDRWLEGSRSVAVWNLGNGTIDVTLPARTDGPLAVVFETADPRWGGDGPGVVASQLADGRCTVTVAPWTATLLVA